MKKELWKREPAKWSDTELIGELTSRYAPTQVPPCRVCGGELSIQAVGGGLPTKWACSGYGEDGIHLPDRSLADQHYRDSQFEDRRQGGDGAVIEALSRWAAVAKTATKKK
jgi:hypothetical protein